MSLDGDMISVWEHSSSFCFHLKKKIAFCDSEDITEKHCGWIELFYIVVAVPTITLLFVFRCFHFLLMIAHIPYAHMLAVSWGLRVLIGQIFDTSCLLYKTSQELQMVSSVTLNCQVTTTVMLWGSKLSEMSAMSQLLWDYHLNVFSICHRHCLCVGQVVFSNHVTNFKDHSLKAFSKCICHCHL